jgi:hypothetical protein
MPDRLESHWFHILLALAGGVLTIALAIGASASVFTVADGFLFTPLPYEQPEELVTLWSENPPLGWERSDVNPADVWDLRTRSTLLEDAAVFYEDGLSFTGDGPPELVTAVRMTPNMLLRQGGARAALGLLIGQIAAFGSTSAMGGILVGVSPGTRSRSPRWRARCQGCRWSRCTSPFDAPRRWIRSRLWRRSDPYASWCGRPPIPAPTRADPSDP